MKNTTWEENWKRVVGTSFHGTTIRASLDDLIEALGYPDIEDSPDGKITYEWIRETEDGDVYTIYDYKEYRKFGLTEQIDWHIGARCKEISEEALEELYELL